MPADLRESLIDRLATLFTVGDGCWEWTGYRDRDGYGKLWAYGSKQYAHRVLYELFVGPIPAGLVIDHLCRNRGCVRPAHLEPVTSSENIRRGAGDGQTLWAGFNYNTLKTHCKHGHEYDEANTYHYGSERVCRTCQREKMRRHRARRRQLSSAPS